MTAIRVGREGFECERTRSGDSPWSAGGRGPTISRIALGSMVSGSDICVSNDASAGVKVA